MIAFSVYAYMLQVMRYEAVHPFEGWEDLRKRLGPSRRVFAFFHRRYLHTAATSYKACQHIMQGYCYALPSCQDDPFKRSGIVKHSMSNTIFLQTSSLQASAHAESGRFIWLPGR